MAKGNSMNHEVLITGIGNPNVDKIVELHDKSIFEEFDLPIDVHRAVSAEFLQLVVNRINELGFKIKVFAGGCSQNTLRIFQWIMNSKFNSVMIGSVGVDDKADFLEQELKNSGIVNQYTKLSNVETSAVLILIYKSYRSPVYDASLGAATLYSLDHLQENKTALNFIKNSKIVLLEGFFTVHSPEVGLEIIKICSDFGVITSFNISGEYVTKLDNFDACVPFVKSCNIVIGNKSEFFGLCHLMNIPIDDFHQSLISVYKIMSSQKPLIKYNVKIFEKYQKLLIVTNGPDRLYCVLGSNDVIEHSPQIVEERLIKDSTGAGDSFLAGFLYGVLHDFPISQCLEIGCKTAAEVIQVLGCAVPNKNSSDVINY